MQKAAPALRDAVTKTKPGSATIVTLGGVHTLVLVMSHERAGQRDLSTPEVRENITANLRARREQLIRDAYLMALRTDANVVNYLARRIYESNGKMAASPPAPTSTTPTTPGAK